MASSKSSEYLKSPLLLLDEYGQGYCSTDPGVSHRGESNPQDPPTWQGRPYQSIARHFHILGRQLCELRTPHRVQSEIVQEWAA